MGHQRSLLTRICTVPCGGMPVDQTACPLTVTLPPATAGLGSRVACNVSVPAGGSEAVTGGPEVPGGWEAPVLGGNVVLGGTVVPVPGGRVVLGGRVDTYTGARDLVILVLSPTNEALSHKRSTDLSHFCMTAGREREPHSTHACMLCTRDKPQGLTGKQVGSTVRVVGPVESPKYSPLFSSANTAVMTKSPPAQLQRSVVLSSYVPTAAPAHACLPY